MKRRPQIGPSEVTRITESIEGLRESVEGMRDEIGEVFDRLDFNERVLSQLADGARVVPKELPEDH